MHINKAMQILMKELSEAKNKQINLNSEYDDLNTQLKENIIHRDNIKVDISDLETAIRILKTGE